jgi:hypothetical protein
MIEKQTIDGQPVVIAYFDPGFQPANKATATYAKLFFDDGRVILLSTIQPQVQDGDDEAEAFSRHRTKHQRPLVAPDIEPEAPEPPEPGDLPTHVQLAAWAKAVAVLDASEILVRDRIERDLTPIAGLSHVKITDMNLAVNRLMRRIAEIRIGAIKVAFRLLRARLGDEPVLDKSLATWAQYFAREDVKGIDTAIRTGLIAGLDSAEIARKVVGSMGLNGIDGVTEFTRHKIGHLGRAAIKASILRKRGQS